MRPLPTTLRRALRAPLALLLATAAAVLAAAPPAAAHGTLAVSTPVEGATVSEPLSAVELYFTEKVASNAYFTITAPGGGRVDNGWTHGSPKPLDKPVREYFMVEGKFEPREYSTGFPAVVTVAHLPVAAAEQHGSTGHGSTGAPAAPPASSSPAVAAPPAAPPVAAEDGGGSGWIAWSGWAVAIAAAVAGFVGWRRRPAPAGKPSGRARPSGAASGPRGGARPGGKAAGASGRSGDSAAGAAGTSPARGLTNTRLALLAGGLVVALLAGFGLGRLGTGDPPTTGAPAASAPASADGGVPAGDGHQHPAGTGAHSHPDDGGAGQAQATGMAVSAGGYTLQPERRGQAAGAAVDYRFRIVGADRQPATRFAVVHDKPLHLVVVGRDLSGYQHLHPTMAPDGTWSVPLKLARPGGYRVYADFSVTAPDGTQLPLVLGVDHHVPGAHTPAALPPAAPQATAGPFAVSTQGTPTVGVSAPMLFRVSRTGAPGPSRLERYLGAYGHLVVVREGDLGYVHVHPETELVDGAVKFWLTAPSTGRYRAFFDFQVAGKVHTAEYTMDIP
jgi:CopC domain